jgi:RNA polymerase sigma factor (TIGR02999 family)
MMAQDVGRSGFACLPAPARDNCWGVRGLGSNLEVEAMDEPTRQLSETLHRINDGDHRAARSLFPLVYQQLRRRAAQLLAGERRDHTLQRTALVHEAYLRLVDAGCAFQGRLHFLNAAALAMRRILINHARDKGRVKRGGRMQRANLDEAATVLDENDRIDWLALDEALEELGKVSPRQAQVVNLRYFAGLSDGEIAELLKISPPTVRRDWATARPWLYRRMCGSPQCPGSPD